MIAPAARRVARTALTALLERLDVWHGLLVLTYHRIGDPDACPLDRRTFSATPEGFAEQIDLLARRCDVVDLRDWEPGRGGRGRQVAVTFDDGYRDNATVALPVLRRAGVPATFFVTPGLLDRRELPWWDEVAWRLRGLREAVRPPGPGLPRPVPRAGSEDAIAEVAERCKRAPGPVAEALVAHVRRHAPDPPEPSGAEDLWMRWDEVRDLHRAGMAVGGHTMTHPVLTAVPEARQDEEIGASLRRVADETGEDAGLFAYPVGRSWAFGGAARAAAARHGARLAFALDGGHVPAGGADRLALPRASVSTTMTTGRVRSALAAPQAFARW